MKIRFSVVQRAKRQLRTLPVKPTSKPIKVHVRIWVPVPTQVS